MRHNGNVLVTYFEKNRYKPALTSTTRESLETRVNTGFLPLLTA